MKPEFLEALLLDRALGELSPEVSALLDSHLAQNPAAALRASELATTLALARTAVVAPPAAAPRPLDLARLQRAHDTTRAATRSTEILRLAACLALGLGLGWFARMDRQPPLVPTPVAVTPTPAPAPALAPTPRRAPEATTHFWSVARFAPEAAQLRADKKL